MMRRLWIACLLPTNRTYLNYCGFHLAINHTITSINENAFEKHFRAYKLNYAQS